MVLPAGANNFGITPPNCMVGFAIMFRQKFSFVLFLFVCVFLLCSFTKKDCFLVLL